MSMGWVLILILRLENSPFPVVEQIEFSSQASCEVAKREIDANLQMPKLKYSDDWGIYKVLTCAQR